MSERGNSNYGSNPIEWTGRIGLMYPSDYGFAVGGEARETCLGTTLYRYNTNNCQINNWLYKNNITQWTLMPHNSIADNAFSIEQIGYVNYVRVYYNNLDILPTLYLNSDVEIIGGDGSNMNPFQLSI